MVRLARFERATPCLGGRCSIQLSYNRNGYSITNFSALSNMKILVAALSMLDNGMVQQCAIRQIGKEVQFLLRGFHNHIVIRLRLRCHILIQCMVNPQTRITHISRYTGQNVQRPISSMLEILYVSTVAVGMQMG